MTKTRIKKKVAENVTLENAESAFGALAKADADNQKMLAELDLKITEMRKTYQETIDANNKVIEENTEVLATYLVQHPDALGKRRSMKMAHGTIGYRLGQPTIERKGKLTVAACVRLTEAILPSDYIRTKKELDKERLLSDRNKVVTDVLIYPKGDPIFAIEKNKRPTLESLFAECGLRVKQDETFFIDLDKATI